MRDDETLNERLNQAVLAFGELAELDPEHWQDRETIGDLNQSRELDRTGLTTFMLLGGMLERFTEETTFSAKEILAAPDAFEARLRRIRAVKEAVEHPDAVALMGEFRERLHRLARTLEVEGDRIEVVTRDPGLLGHLRRDALRSMERLGEFRFLVGESGDEPLRLNKTVFEFWNINSLLRLLARQNVAGVSLCLIRDPEQAMASYFVLAIKQGENIVVLTDREAGPHPGFYRMSRRRGRTLDGRARKNWFPYHLLDLEPIHGRGGNVKDLKAKSRTGLVPSQAKLIPLTTISELDPGEIVWLLLLYTRIEKRYGEGLEGGKPLAYTGEMVVDPEALVGSTGALVASGQYRPLELPPLRREDVTAETTAKQWRRPPIGHNEWMLDRYGESVSEDVLNPVGEERRRELEAEHRKLLTGETEEEYQEGRRMAPWREESRLLETLSPVTLGRAEDIERDRLWVARVNQCRVVQREAEIEFERDKDEVMDWYRARISERREVLIEAAVRGEMVLPSERRSGFGPVTRGQRNVMKRVVGITRWDEARGMLGGAVSLTPWEQDVRFHYRCADDGVTTANTFARIAPDCADALAELLDLPLDELPIGLRHWRKDGPYVGNSILDRIDPSDWVLGNPWNQLGLDVLVPLSKRAFNRRAKELGVEVPAPQ